MVYDPMEDYSPRMPYILLEFGDTYEAVKDYCYVNGAVILNQDGDEFHLKIQGSAFPKFFTEEQMKSLFPVKKVRYSDFPQKEGY